MATTKKQKGGKKGLVKRNVDELTAEMRKHKDETGFYISNKAFYEFGKKKLKKLKKKIQTTKKGFKFPEPPKKKEFKFTKKQTGGNRSTFRKKGVIPGDAITGESEYKRVKKSRRKGKIGKYKRTERLLAGEKGSTYSSKVKSKTKDGKLKKRTEKIVDRYGTRKTKVKTRVTRKGVTKSKKVVWEDGKRKVIKMRNGVVVKRKGYKTGGFLEPPIENI